MRERRRKFTGNYKSSLSLGRASFTVLGVLLTFAALLLSLSQSNAVSVKGDSLSSLEKRKVELTEERERLQVEATRLQSLQEIEGALDDTGDPSRYVPVQKINYLPSSNVAVK